MKLSHFFAAGALALSLAAAPMLTAQPAQAVGCISGAIAGGVAGHYAGHHGVMGAVGGCIAGHHIAKLKKQKAREDAMRQQQMQPTPTATPN